MHCKHYISAVTGGLEQDFHYMTLACHNEPVGSFSGKLCSVAEKLRRSRLHKLKIVCFAGRLYRSGLRCVVCCHPHLRFCFQKLGSRGRSQWPHGLSPWTFFARPNTGVLGSNTTWGMDVCVHLFCLCCSVCMWRPCDGLIPRPRSPTDCVD
jgi:hypothetical protein